MSQPNPVSSLSAVVVSLWQRFGSTIKFLFIGILVLLMLIPLAFVSGLVSERQQRWQSVQNEISQHWGQAQGLVGPVLMVPYHTTVVENGKRVGRTQAIMILPETLSVTGTFKPELRKRGIFESVVYRSKLDVQARFAPLDQEMLQDAAGQLSTASLDLAHATIGFGLNDPKGIQSGSEMSWQGHEANLTPAEQFSGLQSHVNASALLQKQSIPLTLSLVINGSQLFGVTPLGKTTFVKLQAPWGSPSFTGAYLPQKRTVTDQSFSADWEISHLSRRYPQLWRQDNFDIPLLETQTLMPSDNDDYVDVNSDGADMPSRIRGSGFGVSLMTPVNFYQQTERTLKYGILFFTITFLIYFLFEMLAKANIHVLQYVLVGLALSVFYLLLLSLSEFLGFGWAYLIASASTIGLITYYSSGFVERSKQWVVPACLAAVYYFLFTLLQLEDYSLLFGTIGLFAMIGLLMMVTRKIHQQSPKD